MKKILLVFVVVVGLGFSTQTIFANQYVKLDSQGNELSQSATEWSMVYDKANGLIWEVKQNGDDVQDYENPHDADNLYSYTNKNRPHSISVFLKNLNVTKFGGCSDWRIPTLKELESLVDCKTCRPATTCSCFPQTKSSFYWSSSSGWLNTNKAFYIGFDQGFMQNAHKLNNFYVRAVCSVNK